MSLSAAERIIIDDDVLADQQRTLASAQQRIAAAAELAREPLSASGFGQLCSFLVGPMNAMAAHISEAARLSAELAARMETAVGGAREKFAAHEEQTAAEFDRFEVGR